MTDIIEWVLVVFDVLYYVPVIVTVCSAIAATTDTPADDKAFAKVYKYIDKFAINVGKAKQ